MHTLQPGLSLRALPSTLTPRAFSLLSTSPFELFKTLFCSFNIWDLITLLVEGVAFVPLWNYFTSTSHLSFTASQQLCLKIFLQTLQYLCDIPCKYNLERLGLYYDKALLSILLFLFNSVEEYQLEYLNTWCVELRGKVPRTESETESLVLVTRKVSDQLFLWCTPSSSSCKPICLSLICST